MAAGDGPRLSSAVVWLRSGSLAPFTRINDKGLGDDPDVEARLSPRIVTRTTSMNDGGELSKPPEALSEDLLISNEYNLEDYDDEDGQPVLLDSMDFADEKNDPYLVENDEDSELEEMAVLPDDLVILSATTDVVDEFSHLDVHVYEAEENNLFCHHDFLLSSFPLCISPVTLTSKEVTAVAIGTFEPQIEVWDLNVLNPTKPLLVLGGRKDEKMRRKRKRRTRTDVALKPGSHSEAVMSLDYSISHSDALLSGSADKTVKLWDLSTATAVQTYSHHDDKVQAVAWHPSEHLTLTTAFDRRLCLIDTRTSTLVQQWTLTADPEAAEWDPFYPNRILVATEDGNLCCFDRSVSSSESSRLWMLSAHQKACSSLSIHPTVSGVFATGSLDKTVKIWTAEGEGPRCLFSRGMSSAVYSLSFCPDAPELLGVGSMNVKSTVVWDTSCVSSLREFFAERGLQLQPRSSEENELQTQKAPDEPQELAKSTVPKPVKKAKKFKSSVVK